MVQSMALDLKIFIVIEELGVLGIQVVERFDERVDSPRSPPRVRCSCRPVRK